MKKFTVLLFINLFCFRGFSQKENYQWTIGDNGLMDFNSGSLILGNTIITVYDYESNANICDSSGQLIILTNGNKVYNAQYDTMLNSYDFNDSWFKDNYNGGSALNYSGGLWPFQSSLVIPFPDNDSLYYIFYETITDSLVSLPFFNFKLYYSIVNIHLDNGKGALTVKNIFIDDSLTTGITAVKHGNGRDWWLVSKEWHNTNYLKWLVTPNVINGPFVQSVGPNWSIYDGGVQSAFSPDGNKFAASRGYAKKVELYDFDRCSGLLSNHVQVSILDSGFNIAGVCFSPDNHYMYADADLSLFQYDLLAANIPASAILIDSWDSTWWPFEAKFSAMQLAPDGKIYMSAGGNHVMHIINFPDSLGTACNFVQHPFIFPTDAIASPPHFANYSLGAKTGSPCDTLTSIKHNNIFIKDLKIFPNPNEGIFSVNYILPQNTSGILDVFNTLGEKVYSYPLPKWSSVHKIKLTDIPQGIYLCKITCTSTSAVVKFIKE